MIDSQRGAKNRALHIDRIAWWSFVLYRGQTTIFTTRALAKVEEVIKLTGTDNRGGRGGGWRVE